MASYPAFQPVDANGNVIGASGTGSTPTTVTGTVKGYRDSTVTTQAANSVTAPAAGGVIATITIPSAGLSEVTATYYLSGTVAAGDGNNIQLRQNATVRLSPLPVPAVANAFPVPATVVLNCAGGDTVSVNAIGVGAAGAVYSAVLVARQVG